jgi:hypothetical protein
MAFDTIEKFETRALYFKTLRKELSRLGDEPQEFWFFDGFPIEGVESPVLVTGRFKAGVIKELRGRSLKKARGMCRLDGHRLLVEVQAGKAPRSSLKEILANIAGYRVSVVGAVDED